MKRSKLYAALALTTAVGGLGLSAFAPSANAVNLSHRSQGDFLIFPYITARDGWNTALNFTNTSDSTIAVKFRFLEGSNSRDVLDFNLVMSPHDVFAGSISANASGNPVFKVGSNDTTCAVPAIPAAGFPFNSAAYTGAQTDFGPTDMVRLREGYAIVIVMGHAPAGDEDNPLQTVAYNAKHVLGTDATSTTKTFGPRDCSKVVTAFKKINIVNTAKQFGEPINALKGNYNITNPTRGVSMGGSAVALANFVQATTTGIPKPPTPANCTAGTMFFNPTTSVRNPAWDPTTTGCPNLITAQEPYDFLEPSFADAFPNTAVSINDDTGAIQSTSFNATGAQGAAAYGLGYLAVSEILRAQGLVNEWSFNSTLGTTTEWVITQPTKNFFVDGGYPTVGGFGSQQSALSKQRMTGWALAAPQVIPSVPSPGGSGLVAASPPFSEAYSSVAKGQSCTEVGITFYDREEQKYDIVGGVVPSPAPRDAVALCFETNVVRFSDNNDPIFGSSYLLDLSKDLEKAVANGTLKTPFGWLDMKLDVASSAQKGANGSPLLGSGLPVIGFMAKQRTFGPGGAALNFGYLTDHTYRGRGAP